jgi:hypothetical protein
MIPPRHQPCDLHRQVARVVRDRLDGRRDHLVDPVLEPELAVAEGDRPVVDEIRGVAEREQVLGHARTAPEVEAARRRGQRRDEQDRRPAPAAVGRAVAVHRPLRPLVDDRAGSGREVGDTRPERHVPRVRAGVESPVDPQHPQRV